jgi:hypothetical protein
MLRIVRTELYFHPFEIKWRFPELIFGNPSISMMFYSCDPESIEFDELFHSPFSDATFRSEPLPVLRAFVDATVQSAPFRAFAFSVTDEDELNSKIIDQIFQTPVVIENSPPEGIPFGTLLSGASIATVGTYVGLQGIEGHPFLFIAVPAGIIVVGTAVAISRAIDKGLNNAVERATKRKKKARAR